MTLHESAKLEIIIKPVQLTLFDDESILDGSIDTIFIRTPQVDGLVLIGQLDAVSVNVPNIAQQKQANINILNANMIIPHGFVLANIIENISNNVKGIKQLLRTHLAMRFDEDKGRRRYHQHSFENRPTVHLKIETFFFEIDDEQFESQFLSNFRSIVERGSSRAPRALPQRKGPEWPTMTQHLSKHCYF